MSDRSNLIGISSAIGATVCFSVNDMTIKFLSGDYALHQIILIRSLIGTFALMAIAMPLAGGWKVLRTKNLRLHVLRGLCVVVANMSFFLALSRLPLADATTIMFVSPMLITAMSAVILGEYVGPRRWIAVGIGLVGVTFVMQPGAGAFQPASFLPLIAACFYATLHILTRKIGRADSALTMVLYVQFVFVVASALFGLIFGRGTFLDSAPPALEFLLRPWVWPPSTDWGILAMVGVVSAVGGTLISQAYRLCEAGLAAPFEYLALPLSVFWGVMIFGDWPVFTTWAGILLILSGGLYMIWREVLQSRPLVAAAPPKRR